MSQKLMSNYCKKKSVISESEARSEATENNNNEKKSCFCIGRSRCIVHPNLEKKI